MVYGPQHGQVIQEGGTRMRKRPNPVYMLKLSSEATVETNEGTLRAHAGDFVAYDPISGHVWPVAASYVAQHYDEAPQEKEA